MYHILYVSTAAVTMSDEELDQLLKQSHLNNSKNNITGMLLYCNNNFIQVLEGKEADVKKTFQRIEQD